MSKMILIPRSVNMFLSIPFSFLRENVSKFFFSGGFINSISNLFKIDSSASVDESDEFYLNIRSEPLSPKISEASILNKEEVEEQRSKEDDLLNIYIPIARKNSLGEVLNYGFLNSNFNFIKKSNEKRMAGFYKSGTVYLSGFILFSPSGEIIQTVKVSEIKASEGDVLHLNVSGTIKTKPDKKNDFYFSGFSFSSENNVSFGREEFKKRSDEDDQERDLTCSFSFPIGMVYNANYVPFAGGNVEIRILSDSITYFLQEVEGESIFETNYIYTFAPHFK